jgi:hypothetical protein
MKAATSITVVGTRTHGNGRPKYGASIRRRRVWGRRLSTGFSFCSTTQNGRSAISGRSTKVAMAADVRLVGEMGKRLDIFGKFSASALWKTLSTQDFSTSYSSARVAHGLQTCGSSSWGVAVQAPSAAVSVLRISRKNWPR